MKIITMPNPDFTNPQFWKELRKRTSLDGQIGDSWCYVWCDEILGLLSNYGNHRFKRIETELLITEYRDGTEYGDHQFLARKYPSGIFIADGTAGQFDLRYPYGYYNYVINAPKKIKMFYDNGIKQLKKKKPKIYNNRLFG